MAKLTYSQLEGLWIQNGGSTSLAPVMAAIALAESGGNPSARNDKDNGGTQSSFGLWQISTGTHTPPASNWADPNENARLAVGKYKSQGLKAWGTYTSGAYTRFLANGVPPSSIQSSSALSSGTSATATADTSTTDYTCAWNLSIPVKGNVCVATKSQARATLAVLIMGTGLAVALIGLILIVKQSTATASGAAVVGAARVLVP
jgi:hypothetical protein